MELLQTDTHRLNVFSADVTLCSVRVSNDATRSAVLLHRVLQLSTGEVHSNVLLV